jgi:hypothetical protein
LIGRRAPALRGSAPGNCPSGTWIMLHRQTVEFLRRRYALAILRDDADTAGRLRAQLDGVMNLPGAAPRSEARAPEACPGMREAPAGRQPSAAGLASGPQLCLVRPVTGLLEAPRRDRRDR